MVTLVKKYQGLSDVKLVDLKKVNPHADEAQAIAKQLCKKIGIYLPNFDEYNTMSAYLFPHTSLDRLVAVILINNFLYYVDEIYERHARHETDQAEDTYLRDVFDNCVQIMLYGKRPETEHKLYDASMMIHHKVLPLTNHDWLLRFISAILQHLKSTTYTLDDIMDDGSDPIEAYIALRELDGGMRPTMHLIEFTRDIYLPKGLKQYPYIRSVEDPTANIGGLMNDIFSYQNEVIKYGSRFNLVAMLEDHYDLTFDEAVSQAVHIVNSYTDAFKTRSQQIPDFGNDETNRIVAQYVDGLKDQVNATWHWQISTNRYRSPDSPHPELRCQLD